MAADPWDIDPNQPKESALDELAIRASRSAASQRARALSDVNAGPAKPEYDKATGVYVYETVPVPIKRLFGSPLAQKGPYATGPSHERLISSGWGDARSNAYDRNVNTAARHMALDFVAPWGESVFSAAAGKVVFVGYQSRQGAASTPGCHATGARDNPPTDDEREQILDGKGNVVASTALGNIGFGGIAVYVQHTGDFQGYKTGYFHLSNTTVVEGQKVEEGELLGNIGGTGGYYGWFHKGTHLHFQVEFTSGGLRVMVRPTAMVPNYWPGHLDSTNSSQATDILMPLVASVGGQVAASRVANVLSSINRATTIQNKSTTETAQDRADHATRTAQIIDVQRTAQYASVAAFQGRPPVVTAPMTFDFDNGVWLVNGQPNGAV
jgi:murein DD-endopeptidase MepM/ murein hydrolase activator NlpD